MSSNAPNGRSPRCSPYENALHDLREVATLELASPGADAEARYRKLLSAAALVSAEIGAKLMDDGIGVEAIQRELFTKDEAEAGEEVEE